jgi:hypothetical protein
MNLTTIIVVVRSTGVSLEALVWLHIHSTRSQRKLADEEGHSSTTNEEQGGVS